LAFGDLQHLKKFIKERRERDRQVKTQANKRVFLPYLKLFVIMKKMTHLILFTTVLQFLWRFFSDL
jgi:hypothetical protein